MKQTLGESAVGYSTATKWYTEFKRGTSTCDDMPHCQRRKCGMLRNL